MRPHLLTVIRARVFMLILCLINGAAFATADHIGARLGENLKPYPRLLIDAACIDRLNDKPADELSARLRARFFADAQSLLGLRPLERKLEGRRAGNA